MPEAGAVLGDESMSGSIRIIGIDPGSRVTGYGIVDAAGSRIRAVEWGEIRTNGDHFERLQEIFDRLSALMQRTAPHEIAIERVFLHRNADSALKLGQARAAALCATFGSGVSIHEYAARQIKKALVGNGAAEKAQIQHMIRLVLGLAEAPGADAADALAAAVCHAQIRATAGLVTRAAGPRRVARRR